MGSDALRITVATSLDTLKDKLGKFLEISRNDDYKRRYPWIDNIKEVRDKGKSDELNGILFHKLERNELEDIELALPEIVDYSLIEGFQYNRRLRVYGDYISIRDFCTDWNNDKYKKSFSVENVQKKKIFAIDGNGEVVYSWSAFHCMNAEILEGDNKYVLSDGKWYEVNELFAKHIDDYFARLTPYREALPHFDPAKDTDVAFIKATGMKELRSSEGAYNRRVANERPVDFELFDLKDTRIPGQDKIEFCDLYEKGGALIHVKKYSKSQVLSALISQGTISAVTFKRSSEYRQSVNKHLRPEFRLKSPSDRIDTGQFMIVYAIIDEREVFSLPFFTKVNMKQAFTLLDDLGYKYALTRISSICQKVRKVLPRK